VTGVSVAVFVISLFGSFLVGVIVGIMLIVARASRREDQRASLWGPAPGAQARGTRRILGVHNARGHPDDAWAEGISPATSGPATTRPEDHGDHRDATPDDPVPWWDFSPE
jgi:hypothetical protein